MNDSLPSLKAFFTLPELNRSPRVRDRTGNTLQHNFIWGKGNPKKFSKQFTFLLCGKFWKTLTFHYQTDFLVCFKMTIWHSKNPIFWSVSQILDTNKLTFSKIFCLYHCKAVVFQSSSTLQNNLLGNFVRIFFILVVVKTFVDSKQFSGLSVCPFQRVE